MNSWIPSKIYWYLISRETGFRIQGRLRREANSVISKYKRATGSKKKEELNSSARKLSILVSGLVSVGKMEDDLHQANSALVEWRETCADLEKEKESLLKEMASATERKETDAEISSLDRELCEYVQRMAELTQATSPNFGKTITIILGERQRLRRIKELKDRADLALWFLDSHGLQNIISSIAENNSYLSSWENTKNAIVNGTQTSSWDVNDKTGSWVQTIPCALPSSTNVPVLLLNHPNAISRDFFCYG